MQKIERLLLVPSSVKQIPNDKIKYLCELIASEKCDILTQSEFGSLRSVFPSIDIIYSESEIKSCDLVLVLGGDGSFLSAARIASRYSLPIAGVNFGRLGYLAELEYNNKALLEKLISGDFSIENRIMLDASVISAGDNSTKKLTPALNDIVIANGPISRLLSFDLYCDGELAVSNRADGLVIATPTGSTAYSMSAGGPVLDPRLDCIVATMICPHSLTSRPIVFDGKSKIELRNLTSRDTEPYIMIDGRDIQRLNDSDIISIVRSTSTVKFARVRTGGFLSTLREKMI